MYLVPERAIAELISARDCFTAVEQVFASMARRSAYNFPVIREAIGHRDALYGFKSGFDRDSLALGLKSGGYWPHNHERGLINHQSTIFLFDADTGKCKAVVGANLITALRTAAAAAVSVAHLARKDARTLGIVGAGHQAGFQLRAVLEQRPFGKVVAWNRTPDKLAALEKIAVDRGLEFQAVSLEELGAQSDVIVTITSSFAPVLENAVVKDGTHVVCMGTDTKGKQEVSADLVARAATFTDEVAQAVTIGECQHALALGAKTEAEIIEIGAVINGTHPGRTSEREVTLFDGTGVGLQDLAVAEVVLRSAIEKGAATEVEM
ncbi:ornithine cyclodeaminase family protein [Nisaea acidiphila]|uniref:Ornithine cyclodeaminase family protein n=1 Tax=Nisaea acidiphila TaxID=1862145 RepID=A0A9J7AS11_9PROT|nr:iminosuccinate reductase BhcD [Nisaea acidiphila]UUX48101.1 ornithine cyclodeaminase family protein [Nisaea acidiphila]